MHQHEESTEEEKGEEYIPPKERSEIIAEKKGINNELFKNYFKYQSPSDKKLKTQKTQKEIKFK